MKLHDGSDYPFTASRSYLGAEQTVTMNATLSQPQPTSNNAWQIVPPGGRLRLNTTLTVPPLGWLTHSSSVPASALNLTYQWNRLTFAGKVRTDTPIPGATSATYTTSVTDLRKQISVTVTARHPLLKTATTTIETDNPVMRYSRIKVKSARWLPKKKYLEFKVQIAADGLPYATGKVDAYCRYKNGRALDGPNVTLKKGRATIRFKAKGVKAAIRPSTATRATSAAQIPGRPRRRNLTRSSSGSS